MDRFNRIDNTSPVVDVSENSKPDVPRSKFDFSRMNYTTANIGLLQPVDLIPTLPNEDYDISYDVLAMVRNPLNRRIFSGMRIYLHTYYCKNSDLWEGWNNFITKGRSGKIELEIPYIRLISDSNKTTVTPLSLSDSFGVPIIAYDNTHPLECYKRTAINSNTRIGYDPGKVSALPYVMYQKICADKYFNKNLLQNNKNWYPDNSEHFILPYEATEVNVLDYHNPLMSDSDFDSLDFGVNGPVYNPVGIASDGSDDTTPVVLDSVHYRQFKGDDFTSANPFIDMLRGTAPTMDILAPNSLSIDFSDSMGTDGQVGSLYQNVVLQTYNGVKKLSGLPSSGSSFLKSDLLNALNKAKISNPVAQITLSKLRELNAYTKFLERNARTDGDYNSEIYAHYGINPHSQDKQPVYIGGCYQDIAFSEVLQTSATSSVGEDVSPLGSQVGRGVSASSGYIGKFHSQDYGYIMTIMSIVPDTVYTQGIPRWLTNLNQSSQYFPLLNELSPQAILNKELYVSGNSVTDNDVYGYEERFSEYKSRRNRSSGLISLPSDKSAYDSALVMARRFSSTPQLSNKFVSMCPQNIDMKIFMSDDEPPFDMAIASHIKKVSPIPYLSIPGGI